MKYGMLRKPQVVFVMVAIPVYRPRAALISASVLTNGSISFVSRATVASFAGNGFSVSLQVFVVVVISAPQRTCVSAINWFMFSAAKSKRNEIKRANLRDETGRFSGGLCGVAENWILGGRKQPSSADIAFHGDAGRSLCML